MKNLKMKTLIYRIVYRLSLDSGSFEIEFQTRFRRRYENKLKQIDLSDNRELLTIGNFSSSEIPPVYKVISGPFNDDGLPF